MEFLGFDIYLIIVVVAAVLVGGIMFFMAKTIGRKPGMKKQVPASPGKNKKILGLKPRPALKAPAGKKPAVKPVSKPALKKRAVVPVAAGRNNEEQDQSDSLSLEMVSKGKGQAVKTGEPIDLDPTMIPEEPVESADQIVGAGGTDQPPDDETGEPENMTGQQDENNPETDGPVENEGDVVTTPASAPSDVLAMDKKEEGEEPKTEGGLLDLFEEEEEEDAGNSMLAAKLEDVDSKSLEEIGKEISQSLLSKY